jgi:hypothetical protein
MFLERKLGGGGEIGGVNMRAGTRESNGEMRWRGEVDAGDDKIPFLCTICNTVRNPE